MLNKCINARDYQVSSPGEEPIQLCDVLWIPNTQEGVQDPQRGKDLDIEDAYPGLWNC